MRLDERIRKHFCHEYNTKRKISYTLEQQKKLIGRIRSLRNDAAYITDPKRKRIVFNEIEKLTDEYYNSTLY